MKLDAYINVCELIEEVERVKKVVVDYHILAENVSSLDESAMYCVECELQMDYCGELMKKIFDLIEKYDLKIDYTGFDTSIIWSYLE